MSDEESELNPQMLSPSDSGKSDIEFSDTQIETPRAFRETSRSVLTKTTTTEIPLKDEPSSSKNKTPTRFNSLPASDRDLIANEKLISDDNQFTPHGNQGSPGRIPRLQWSREKVDSFDKNDFKSAELKDFNSEFDSEDEESNSWGDKGIEQPTITLDERSRLKKRNLTSSPRKSSPLRREINTFSTSMSGSKDDQHERAGKAKSAEDILQSIGTSISRLQESESENEFDDYEEHLDSNPEMDFSDDDMALNDLNELLPSRRRQKADERDTSNKILSDGQDSESISHILRGEWIKSNVRAMDEVFNDEKRTNFVGEKDNSEDLERQRKGSPSRSRNLGKANRKRVVQKSLRLKSKQQVRYKTWPAEKWDKLIRLVDLSVPNDAIISSNLVVRELGCQNKTELAKRVEFIKHYFR